MRHLRIYGLLIVIVMLGLAGIFFWFGAPGAGQYKGSSAFAGTSSCRACHEKFYGLWSSSHHGLAMQPYTEAFAGKELTEHNDPIQVGAYQYQAMVGAGQGYVKESGPKGNKKYKIEHVLGGKNVY